MESEERKRTRQHEHLSLLDGNILKLSVLHDLEQHIALDLVKELFCGLEVVVGASVGTADGHDGVVLRLEEAEVADWGL